MRGLSPRFTATVIGACICFAVAVAAIGALGVLGVRSATSTANGIADDELATATETSDLSRSVDAAYVGGQEAVLTSDAARRAQLDQQLYNDLIPTVDTDLANLVRLHADDSPAEFAGITTLEQQWAQLRQTLNPATTALATGGSAAQLTAAYTPLDAHISELIDREADDAADDQSRSDSASTRVRLWIGGAVVMVTLLAIALSVITSRRLRRMLEPAEEQIEFTDTLQLAEDEDEAAMKLLQRHLERTVADTAVTILNRNNSADRLEAVTTLAPNSPLTATLAHAEPRSCLAVRSGRVHDEDDERASLLACPVCASCPGRSTCTPLTVGGEVIGSVLVNRRARFGTDEQQHIRDAVAQSAPVLANLRNLAIAELRAATDSLTGLPNKRALADTLKRMLAQAGRTLTPLSLVVLDLDHFKEINDRYGHPAGDQALANVGAAVSAALRDSDFAARNGGEEFAILLPDTDVTGARLAAEKVRAAVAEISLPGLDLSITASVGIAVYPEHATSTEGLERLADAALYIAKRSGRDRIEIAIPSADNNILAQAALADAQPQ